MQAYRAFFLGLLSVVASFSSANATDADKAWKQLSSTPETAFSGEARDFSAFLTAFDIEAARIRTEGLEFWKKFKSDNRRHSWLIVTTALAPSYAVDRHEWARNSMLPVANDYALDMDALGAWKIEFEEMKAEFWGSSYVTDQHRRLLTWLEIRNELLHARGAQARGEIVDPSYLKSRVLWFA